jgi:hypothetical protein
VTDDDAPQRRPIKSKSKRDLQLADDWQEWARTASGQRAIADLMTFCDVYTRIETNDPVEMARAVGANNVAKYVAYYLGLTADDFARQSWDDTDLLNKMISSHQH